MNRSICVSIAACVFLAGSAFGQRTIDSVAVRAAGDSAVAHHDWKTLVAVYAPVTRATPDNGLAWFRLGAGLQEMGKLKDAANALRRTIQLKVQVGQAELRLARVLARSGMLDSVTPHLERATATGIPVEMITGEPDLKPVRRDPRYVALVTMLEGARYPCRAMPAAHQFDFWVGDWVVAPWGGTNVFLGRRSENHVTAELEHCVIHEHWASATGGKGESINFWDPNRHAWRQVWMDEGGWSLDYEGQYSDGAMRFNGWTLGPHGERLLQKLTFFNISQDTVRQLFEQSSDSGKTWVSTFDGRYVRLKPNGD